MDECKKESEPWKKWPARMLRHKSLIQCARYAFSLSGIVDPDEAERMIDVTPTVENPVTGEIVAKLPSRFKNSATRKTFCENATKAIHAEKTLKGLNDTYALYETQIIEMSMSSSEYDVMGAEELIKQKKIAENRIIIATREQPEEIEDANFEQLQEDFAERK